MAEHIGTATIIRLISGSGTITLNSQYRRLDLDVNPNLIEITTGGDQWKRFMPGIQEWTINYEGLHNGSDSGLGTTDVAALAPGSTFGTCQVYPFGTAGVSYSGPCIIESRPLSFPYNDVFTVSLTIRGNGAITEG